MSSRTRWLILLSAVVGLGFAIASSWVHYRLLTDPTYVSPCDVSSTFNCSQVYLSQYGSIGGVSVALAGVAWFGLAALIAGFATPNTRNSAAAGYLFALSTVGLGVVLYLAYVSYAKLQTGCLLCMGTYAAVLAIFLLSAFTSAESIGRLPSRLAADLRGLASRPAALVAALVFVVGVASAVAFFPGDGTPGSTEAAPSTVAAAGSDATKNFADSWAKQPRVDLGIPADGAKVIIVKFNDFQCGTCARAESLYKPVLKKFADSHPGMVKYVVKDWPWDTKCNFNAGRTIPGHEAACDSAAAARMAADRGKYDEMAAWLYANQGARPEAVQKTAAAMLGVSDFAREYALKLPEIRGDIADGGVLRINGTPTYFINGVRLDGLIHPQYFELAIDLELEKASS